MTRSSTRRAPLSPTHAATLEISPLARALARRQATHHTRASGYYATAQSACRKITTSVGSYRRRTERRQRSRYEMEAATLVPGERVLDHLIRVAGDAGVRAPQLRHTPNQKSVTDTVRDSAAGNTGASSPQDPKGWGVATSERNDATLARARRGREGETPHNPVRGPWWFLASDPARGHAPTRGDPSRNSRQRGAQAASRTRRAERSLGASNVSVSRGYLSRLFLLR